MDNLNVSQLLIVPTRTSFELTEGRTKNRQARTGAAPRCCHQHSGVMVGLAQPPHGSAQRRINQQRADPNDYLMRGGFHSYEQKVLQMNRAAVQDLRAASDALAAELIRCKSAAEEERMEARAVATRAELEHNTTASKLMLIQERLGEEMRGRHDLERQQHHRLKEIQRRFKEEHAARTAAESDLLQARQQVAIAERSLDVLGEERAGLLDLQVGAQAVQRQAQLITVSGPAAQQREQAGGHGRADSALIAELRGRVAGVETRLECEQAARQEHGARATACEAQLRVTSARCTELSAAAAEAEGRARSTAARSELLDDEAVALRHSLALERDAGAVAREGLAKLQAELAALQAGSLLLAAQASAERNELERVRRDWSVLTQTDESRRAELAALREAGVHTAAQLARGSAAEQRLTQDLDSVQQQLDRLQRSSTLESQEAAERAGAEVARTGGEVAQLGGEVAQLGLRLRLSQESGAQLQREAAAFEHQALHYQTVFREHGERGRQAALLQASLQRAEFTLLEASTLHASQLELWRAEATEVAQAAAKWKQRAILLQEKVDSTSSRTTELELSLGGLSERATSAEQERARLQEVVQTLDAKIQLSHREGASLRQQLNEALASGNVAGHAADSARGELAARDMQLDTLNIRVSQEAGRAAALRTEIAAMTAHHAKEMEAHSRRLTSVTAAVQQEERRRGGAEEELLRLRAAIGEVSVLVCASHRQEDTRLRPSPTSRPLAAPTPTPAPLPPAPTPLPRPAVHGGAALERYLQAAAAESRVYHSSGGRPDPDPDPQQRHARRLAVDVAATWFDCASGLVSELEVPDLSFLSATSQGIPQPGATRPAHPPATAAAATAFSRNLPTIRTPTPTPTATTTAAAAAAAAAVHSLTRVTLTTNATTAAAAAAATWAVRPEMTRLDLQPSQS
ncbi:MAG: hypothetical protein WDW36_009522 [Sanguina aurantia]